MSDINKIENNYNQICENKNIKSKKRYLDNRGFIDPKSLPINFEGFRCCRYCNKSIRPPKRTFCSNDCIHEYRLRTNNSYLRNKVFERDKGICAMCGTDTKLIAKEIQSCKSGDEKNRLLKQNNIPKTRKILRRNGGSLWDADHIVPVKDGGGQCGLENIRTLCISCHKKITFNKQK